jgi:hypothetical protein
VKENTVNFNTATNKSFLLILIAFIFTTVLGMSNTVWAQNVYIDPNASQSGNGSFSSPFNSWKDVQFSSSNDYYQKCNTRAILDSSLKLNSSGSINNYITLGAYFDNGGSPKIGVSGSKPIIEHYNIEPGTCTIYVKGAYVNIKNLEIRKAEKSLRLDGDYFLVEDCQIGGGASVWGIRILGSYGIIRNNIIDSQYDIYEEKTSDGISFYQGATNNKAYGNVIDSWDHSAIMFSGTNSSNEIFNNTTTNDEKRGGSPVQFNNSSDNNKIYNNRFIDIGDYLHMGGGDGNQVYDNIFDGGCCDIDSKTVMINLQAHSGTVRNNKVVGNKFFNAPGRVIKFYSDGSDYEMSGNEISNNILQSDFTDRILSITPYAGNNKFINNKFYANGYPKIWYRNDGAITVEEFNNKSSDTVYGNEIMKSAFTNELVPPLLSIVPSTN